MTSSLPEIVVTSDDEDAYVPRTVINRKKEAIVFTALVAVDDGPYDIAGEWVTPEAPVRTLHVPTFGIPAGRHELWLKTPDNDVSLGFVTIRTRGAV